MLDFLICAEKWTAFAKAFIFTTQFQFNFKWLSHIISSFIKIHSKSLEMKYRKFWVMAVLPNTFLLFSAISFIVSDVDKMNVFVFHLDFTISSLIRYCFLFYIFSMKFETMRKYEGKIVIVREFSSLENDFPFWTRLGKFGKFFQRFFFFARISLEF